MKKRFTQSVKSGAALVCAALLLAVCAGGLKAQNPWPDYDFKAANADGDTLYYRITSATAPYTVAVTRCHDSVYHTLPWPQSSSQVGQPGFVYPVYDYDSAITVPSSVTHNNITYSVTSVDNEAFYMQGNLKSVFLPLSVKAIHTGAFLVSSLSHITMPGVEQIDSYAFYQTKLSQVDIPVGVKLLPEAAFYYSPLTKITFHEGLQEIQEAAFSPDLIDSLIFPGTLRKISLGDNSPVIIYNADSVALKDIACRYVEFKPGTEPLELDNYAFAYFNHLERVVLSDNIVRLGAYCFWECTDIQSIVIPPLLDTIPDGCFMDCHSLSSVVLPPQLTTIKYGAFAGTSMLEHIVIPASVTFIGDYAFKTVSARGLEVIDIFCDVPPTLEGSLSNHAFNTQDTIYVHVPCGTTAAYRSAPGWSFYNNLVYQECVGVADHEPAAFKVWPNPVEHVVNVQCAMKDGQCEVETVEVFDIYGKLIHTVTVADNPARVNVSALPAGVYVLRVTDADGKEYHQKIVKR